MVSRTADASRVYLANGLIRAACSRAFWPLFFTRLVTEVGLSPLELVLLGTAFEAAIFLAEIPTGAVADVKSRRLSVIIGYFTIGAAFVMSAVATPYPLLVAAQVLIGIGLTFHTGAETAWVTDELGSTRLVEPLIIRRSQLQMVAAVVGIGFFAALAALTSLSVSLAAAGLGMIAWGLVLVMIMPEEGFRRSEGDGWAEFVSMVRTGARFTWAVPTLRTLTMVVVLGGVAKEAVDRLDIARLVDVGLPSDLDEAVVVGVLVSARLLLGAALLAVVRARVQGRTVVDAMVVCLVAVAVGVGVLAHSDWLALAAIGLVFQGGFHSATQPLVEVWANTFANSEARATIHSFIGQGESLGEVIGGVSLGVVAQWAGLPTALTVSAVIFALAAVLAGTARRAWLG